MNLSLAATLTYRRHCPDCLTGVEQAVASAIRDREVARLTLVAGDKCDHEPPIVREANRLSRTTQGTPPYPHPQDVVVAAVLASSTGPVATAAPDPPPTAPPPQRPIPGAGSLAGGGGRTPNGFDPNP